VQPGDLALAAAPPVPPPPPQAAAFGSVPRLVACAGTTGAGKPVHRYGAAALPPVVLGIAQDSGTSSVPAPAPLVTASRALAPPSGPLSFVNNTAGALDFSGSPQFFADFGPAGWTIAFMPDTPICRSTVVFDIAAISLSVVSAAHCTDAAARLLVTLPSGAVILLGSVAAAPSAVASSVPLMPSIPFQAGQPPSPIPLRSGPAEPPERGQRHA